MGILVISQENSIMTHLDSEKSILFIGEFPPPYTGVTVKDVALCKEILSGYDIEKFDLYQFKFQKYKFPILCIELLKTVRKAKLICIGAGHSFRVCSIFLLSKLLCGKAFLGNIVVFVMGTGLPEYLKRHPRYIRYLSQGKCLFVEGKSLVKDLNDLGLSNAFYLPNFRSGKTALPPQPIKDRVRFVYFARVCQDKGADTLLSAVEKLNKRGLESRFEVDIWGHVDPEFERDFKMLIEPLKNVRYRGVFNSAENDVYELLNTYDSSASSSSWREGMSGTNIECKFAGIANIVGDGGLNSESVEHGKTGYVVPAGDVDALVEAMMSLIEDHDLLYQMKCASFEDRKDFSTDLWKEKILREIGLKEGSDECI